MVVAIIVAVIVAIIVAAIVRVVVAVSLCDGRLRRCLLHDDTGRERGAGLAMGVGCLGQLLVQWSASRVSSALACFAIARSSA